MSELILKERIENRIYLIRGLKGTSGNPPLMSHKLLMVDEGDIPEG